MTLSFNFEITRFDDDQELCVITRRHEMTSENYLMIPLCKIKRYEINDEFQSENQTTSPFKIERNRFDDDQELCVIAQNYGQGVAKKGW